MTKKIYLGAFEVVLWATGVVIWVAATKRLKKHTKDSKISESENVLKLRRYFANGCLKHPYLTAEYFQDLLKGSKINCSDQKYHAANFTDLACAISSLCLENEKESGKGTNSMTYIDQIKNDIGHNRKHIVLILCDGLGSCFLSGSTNFLNKAHKRANVDLRAVWPSTTPTALTSLATAKWPGEHGIPGWDLRESVGCDFPGLPTAHRHTSMKVNTKTNHNYIGSVQLRILSDKLRDWRSGTPLSELGFTMDDVFFERPWAERMLQAQQKSSEAKTNSFLKSDPSTKRLRRMCFINAYNGDEFPSWYQGSMSDFSAWQSARSESHTGCFCSDSNGTCKNMLVNLETIGETSAETLGLPEAKDLAVSYFSNGIDKIIEGIQMAEKEKGSTFTYFYTAHPDKHMHALGVEDKQVKDLIQSMDYELERLCKTVHNLNLDTSVVITADHGHVTVEPEFIVKLQPELLECLEYANIGVHGRGRHAYFHCRSGHQNEFVKRWNEQSPRVSCNFLLLTIDEAIEEGLFGPNGTKLKVRPRIGDFVAISLNNHTLGTPDEIVKYRRQKVGAHGSLLPEEMSIPYIVINSNN